MTFPRRALILSSLIFALTSCGKSDDDKTAAATQFGTLQTKLLDSETSTAYNLTKATCTSNADVGLFTGIFDGDSSSHLEVRIKNFSTTNQTYTCAQSPDNYDGDLGLKYSGCMVAFSIPSATNKINGYEMYRNAETTPDFTYNKSCTVGVTYVPPKVTLTVNCAGLFQTVLNGTAPNPFNPSVTASVAPTTTATCSI